MYYEDNYEQMFNNTEEKAFFKFVEDHELNLRREYVLPKDVNIAEILSVKTERDENDEIKSCKARIVYIPADYRTLVEDESDESDETEETEDADETEEPETSENEDNETEEAGETEETPKTEKPLLVNASIEAVNVYVSPLDAEAWEDTYNVGTKLCVVTPKSVFPLSDNAKLSCINRTAMNFKGSIVQQTQILKISPMTMGAFIGDLIKAHNKHSLQLIIDGGKVQAILTKRYISSDQRVTFKETQKVMKNGVVGEFAGGYLSHTWTSASYKVASEGKEIEANVRVSDSSTGDGSIAICSQMKVNNSNTKTSSIVFDDSWTQVHTKFDAKAFNLGLNACIQQAQNNAETLAGTMMQLIQHPKEYSKKAIEALNKMAKKHSTTPISKENTDKILANVDAVATYQNLTVWDFISILWEIPQQSSITTQSGRDSLQKTVSRILLLDHEELDII